MDTVSVALPLPIRRTFTYRVPEGVAAPVPGTRVRVPFGERALTGVVTGHGDPVEGTLRELLEVLDDEPVCTPELLETTARVARRFFASQGEVLKSALPARLPGMGAVRYRITEKGAMARPADGVERALLERLAGGETVRVLELPGTGAARREALRRLEERGLLRPVTGRAEAKARTERAFSLARADAPERADALRRSPKGRDVVSFLEEIGRAATSAEIRARTGAGPSVLRALVSRGLLLSFEQVAAAPEAIGTPALPPGRHVLNAAQEQSLYALAAAIRERRFFPALLFGVTGSGKTEVYLRGIETALAAGRGAVWLVPEISLTPVFARRLRRQFGPLAAVFHSALSERERADSWERLRDGRARVVIGPRSAAFAPLPDPGLFIVDEEHDTSYKQRESPRYDARDVVALRARAAGAAVVYGSATPSLEMQEAARRGRVDRLDLPERIDARPLPEVAIVDLRHEPWIPEEKGIPLFSRPLLSRLSEVFARGEQAILLQPRRGFAPVLLCRTCGHDFRCPRCSVARSVHDRGRVLLCHYCGQRDPRPARCPECAGAVLEAVGAGTERVAERFAGLFPNVPFAVLDRDTARRRGIDAVLDDVLDGRVSCLIGTQMVAKGHDFPNVTAVGVLSADTILSFPDFRSGEKTFQLLAQVAGRAGRGDRPGTVHVQTFHPQHPAILRAAAHDAAGFFESEREFRRTFFYPPFSELAVVLVSSERRERAEETAAAIARAMPEAPGLRRDGPAPAPLERLQGRWRWQLLLRAPERTTILAALEAAVPVHPPAGVQIAVDVDPQDLM